MVAVMGGVFSHAEGFTTLQDLIGGLVIHTAAMMAGAACLMLASPVRATAR